MSEYFFFSTGGKKRKKERNEDDIREMDIKTTVRHHFPPVRRATAKKSKIKNAGEDVEKRGPLKLLIGM